MLFRSDPAPHFVQVFAGRVTDEVIDVPGGVEREGRRVERQRVTHVRGQALARRCIRDVLPGGRADQRVGQRLGDGAAVDVDGLFTQAQIDDVRAGSASVDVTAPLQAALDYAKNGPIVRLPAGVYRCDSGLILYKGSRIEGEMLGMGDQRSTSHNGTKIVFTSTTASTYGFDISATGAESGYVWGVGIKDLAIEGASAASTTGINANSLSNAIFDNVCISKFNIGMKISFGDRAGQGRVECSYTALLREAMFGGDVGF